MAESLGCCVEDATALRAARIALDMGIMMAKSTYAQKIQGHLTSGEPRSKSITNFNTRNAQCLTGSTLPDPLNKFYACLEDPSTPPSTKPILPPDDVPLSMTIDVRGDLAED